MDEKIKKSLFYSIIDGSFWSIMYGFGERYLSAFAIFLNASNTQLSLLTSLPILIGSISQFFTVNLIEFFKTRKRFLITGVIIQAISWLLIAGVYFIKEFRIFFLICFVTIYFVSGMISGPAWNSWMGDLVQPEIRGSYFGRRNKISGAVILISTITAGIILDLFKNNIFIGFLILFMIAFTARMFSAYFLSLKFEPEIIKSKEPDFTFFEFLKQARFRNYGLFTLFLSFMNFSIYISAPFFTAYQLQDLKFSYIQYMILLSVAFIIKYFALPVWGKLSDLHGNKKVLLVNGFLLSLIPILWIVNTNFYYLIFVELFSGIVWAGFELSSFNFIFDTTTPEKRAKCISYYNILNGILIFLGASLGGIIVKYNSDLFWTPYYLVFILSGIIRLIISSYFLPKLKEVKTVEHISHKKIFLKVMDMIITESFANLMVMYPKRFRIYKK